MCDSQYSGWLFVIWGWMAMHLVLKLRSVQWMCTTGISHPGWWGIHGNLYFLALSCHIWWFCWVGAYLCGANTDLTGACDWSCRCSLVTPEYRVQRCCKHRRSKNRWETMYVSRSGWLSDYLERENLNPMSEIGNITEFRGYLRLLQNQPFTYVDFKNWRPFCPSTFGFYISMNSLWGLLEVWSKEQGRRFS